MKTLTVILLLLAGSANSFELQEVVGFAANDNSKEFVEGYVAGVRDTWLSVAVTGIKNTDPNYDPNPASIAWETCKLRGAWNVNSIIATMNAQMHEATTLRTEHAPLWYASFYIPMVCPEMLEALVEALDKEKQT